MSDFLHLAQSLAVALKALQMYTANHPRAQEALGAALSLLDRQLGGRSALQFVVSGAKAFVDGQVQDSRNPHVAALMHLVAERGVSGFVFEPGVTAEELLAFLTGLATKPARLEEQGGFEALLDQAAVRHIRVSQTRYQEVQGDGQDATSEPPVPGLSQIPSASTPERLVAFLRQALLSNLGASGTLPGTDPDGLGFLRDIPSADLSGLGTLGRDLGLSEEMPSPTQMGALRQVLLGVDPMEQLRLIAGLASLPEHPAGLALGIKALAGEILGTAVQTLLAQGRSWNQLQGPLQGLLRPLPQREPLVEALAARLNEAGLDGGQALALLRHLAWEELSLEARLLKVLEEGYLFQLTLEQRLALLRELLDLHRDDAFLRILDLLVESLHSDLPELRLQGAQTLAGVAHWLEAPGLPPGGEGALTEAWRAHFGWEPDPPIHRWTTDALGLLLTTLVARGALLQAIEEVRDLEGLCAFLEEPHPWRQDALKQLRGGLTQAPLLDASLRLAFGPDREQVLAQVYPAFEFLGAPMARHLVLRLTDEGDRTRRGRLVEALRAMGLQALPPLMEALGSPTWYLVRNALTLLSDLGDAGCVAAIIPLLRHPEPRVRRTAVRALWKLGGPSAEPHLLAHMKDTDAETLQEILFALGQLKSETSLPPLLELAQDKRVLERLRIQALDTLGHIGSGKALPVLLECLRRKGFFGGGEPPAVRLAAAKALQGLGTPEALLALQKAVEAEPRGEEREALRRLLGPGQPS